MDLPPSLLKKGGRVDDQKHRWQGQTLKGRTHTSAAEAEERATGFHHSNLKVMKKCRTLVETTMDYCSQHFPMWLYLAQMKLMSSSSREEITTTQEKFLNEHRKDFSNAFSLGENNGGSFLRWGGPFLMPLLDKATSCMAACLPTVMRAASSSLQDAVLCPRFS
ncbi:uncharacterized protein LOC103792517 [Callithrix jacchus]